MPNVAACTHRPPCPGCPRYAELGVPDGADAVLADIALRTGAMLDPVVEGAPGAFRVRARLAVRGRAASPKLGIFQEGSHRIADIPSCPIHRAEINAAARAIREGVRETATPPYADAPHAGLLRYVQIVVERSTGRVQVVLVANDRSEQSLAPLAEHVVRKLGDRLRGLWWNGNDGRTNTIFGGEWKLLHGEEAVREHIGGADAFFPPGAFGQSNLDLADRLVEDVHARVEPDRIVAELYSGVGAIGLGLVARSRELRFNEVSPHGLRGLELGIAALGETLRARAHVHPGTAASVVSVVAGAQTVIVDPPRKGLEPEVLAALRAERPPQLLYVSCDPGSLRRDLEALGETFRIGRLTPYALFPYTEHIETLAELSAA